MANQIPDDEEERKLKQRLEELNRSYLDFKKRIDEISTDETRLLEGIQRIKSHLEQAKIADILRQLKNNQGGTN